MEGTPTQNALAVYTSKPTLNGRKLADLAREHGIQVRYEQQVAEIREDKAKIDGSVPKGQLPALKASKTRYILYNQSRRKNGGQLMTRLAELLAKATDGIVADYERPSR